MRLRSNGQCLEISEGVVTAIGTRIDCEHHALVAMALRSVCSLATMNPNGLSLNGKNGVWIRKTSSPIWQQILKRRGLRRLQRIAA
jgi:hypothetical protein